MKSYTTPYVSVSQVYTMRIRKSIRKCKKCSKTRALFAQTHKLWYNQATAKVPSALPSASNTAGCNMETKHFIKQRRLQLGLSQQEVARSVGVSEATVSRWESGDIANMGAGRIKLLAQVLQTSPMEILGGTSASPGEEDDPRDPELVEYLQQLRSRPEMRMLFSTTKNASRAEIERAVKIIQALREGGGEGEDT